MSEEWRPVVGFEGAYEASSFGRVRSLTRVITCKGGRRQTWNGRVLSLCSDNEGRPMVRLYAGSRKAVLRRVHRLVLEAFVGPAPSGTECCHNDGDKLNNRIANLRWDTRAANIRDQLRHGVHAQAAKTHCPQGHPYEGDNLDASMKGTKRQRRCRTCHRAKARARMRRNYVPAAQRRGAA